MGILKAPVTTEKMTALSGDKVKQKSYAFIVDSKANKLQIKAEVERTYGVSIDSVKTMNYFGKSTSRYTKTNIIEGKAKNFKKAIIRLAKNEKETIDFFGTV